MVRLVSDLILAQAAFLTLTSFPFSTTLSANNRNPLLFKSQHQDSVYSQKCRDENSQRQPVAFSAATLGTKVPTTRPGAQIGRLPVRVYVRVRPLVGEGEEESVEARLIEGSDKGKRSLLLTTDFGGRALERYYAGFERVVWGSQNNHAMYTSFFAGMAQDVLAGRTVCAFAYGHTGQFFFPLSVFPIAPFCFDLNSLPFSLR